MTVTDVNERPSISGSSSVSVAENNRTVATFSATDPDGDSITWSDEGTDAGDFTISSSGVLRFSFNPNYEDPKDSNTNNTYIVRVKATDDGSPSQSRTKTVTVTVTDVNERPSISGPSSVNFNENGTGTVATFSATDPEGNSITWSDEGTDAGDFTISSSGVLGFSSTPDYENPADSNTNNIYVVRVKAADDGSPAQSRTKTVNVRVTDVNEPPKRVSTPTVTDAGYTSVRVKWTAPDNSGRPAISDYDVRYRRSNTSTWSNRTFAGTGTTTLISGLTPGALYYAQVRAGNAEGEGNWSLSGSGHTGGGAKSASVETRPDSVKADSVEVREPGVVVVPEKPDELTASASPNPFNPTTTIRLQLPEPGPVSLTLYNLTGQVVRRLVVHQYREAGTHTLTWDGRTDQGHPTAGGVYLYRLLASDQVLLGKMTLLR